ncbi:MAG: inositol monophosphatase family protein [Candidatus Aenigmarchaeota archaeon]|nr:inositol monophosphatase family protein [Candidatus Aenigmarchaeota archaeon]
MKQNKELVFAKEAARKAGKLIVSQADSRRILAFKSENDFVTNVDKNSEKLITSLIRKRFPGHGIMAEEGSSIKNNENMWIIDPLDGTTNFTHGYPFFCVSIALVRNGVQSLGVVYDPLRDEMFHAVAGHGAYLNGKRISVSKATELKDSLLVTGFYYERGKIMRKTLEKMGDFLTRNVHGVRRDGAAALDMCYVACGRVDGYWEYVLSPWDFAASSLIAKEAGAKVTSPSGAPLEMVRMGVLAANPELHKKMLDIVRF